LEATIYSRATPKKDNGLVPENPDIDQLILDNIAIEMLLDEDESAEQKKSKGIEDKDSLRSKVGDRLCAAKHMCRGGGVRGVSPRQPEILPASAAEEQREKSSGRRAAAEEQRQKSSNSSSAFSFLFASLAPRASARFCLVGSPPFQPKT
jgi:hypothetical protein